MAKYLDKYPTTATKYLTLATLMKSNLGTLLLDCGQEKLLAVSISEQKWCE